MTLNSVLGNGNHNNDKFKFDTKDTNTCYDEDKVIIKSVITDTYSYNQPFIPLRISLVQNLKNEKSINMASLYDGVNENIKKKLRKVNSLFIEVSFIYVLLITFMIIVVIVESYNNSKAKVYKIVKNRNGFVFKCKLEDYDLYLCIIEFFIFLIILVKGKNIINYECIFHCTKYITISAMIGIVFGPLMTILNHLFLGNERYSRIFTEVIFNSLCYIAIFILFTWDKIYYIAKKRGNNPRLYFIFKRHELCLVHNSTTCGCKLSMSKEIFRTYIRKSINLYKVCSALFEVIDGKVNYVRMDSKIKYLKNIY